MLAAEVMAEVAELAGRPAAEIADHVRTGKATPREVVEEHLRRIDALRSRFPAFRRVRREEALREADVVAARSDLEDLPLAGVPVAVKGNVPVVGEPTRNGCAEEVGSPAVSDHPVVERMRRAGAVVVGISFMPELGIWGTTDGPWGVVRNPWDPRRTAGGSTGGGAAAVATGMVPVAHATDGLGSIRVPAACCGLVGLKPGAGLVPSQVGVSSWLGMTENGPLATTVEDAALLLSVMADRPGLAEVREPDGPLRIALSTRDPLAGVSRDPEYREAVLDTGRLLAAEGHRVGRLDPPYANRHAVAALSRWFAGAAEDADGIPRTLLQRRTRGHVAAGRLVRRLGAPSEETRRDVRRRFAPLFDRADLLVLPALAGPPIEAGPWSKRGWVANLIANARFAPFAAAWNLAGYPAAVVPAGMHPSGIPLSVQLVAPEGGEALLLSVARRLERLRPWDRHGPVAAPATA